MVPRPVEEVPPPPSIETAPVGARAQWAPQVGGVDGGSTQVEVVVTGATDSAVVLQSLDIADGRCDACCQHERSAWRPTLTRDVAESRSVTTVWPADARERKASRRR